MNNKCQQQNRIGGWDSAKIDCRLLSHSRRWFYSWRSIGWFLADAARTGPCRRSSAVQMPMISKVFPSSFVISLGTTQVAFPKPRYCTFSNFKFLFFFHFQNAFGFSPELCLLGKLEPLELVPFPCPCPCSHVLALVGDPSLVALFPCQSTAARTLF